MNEGQAETPDDGSILDQCEGEQGVRGVETLVDSETDDEQSTEDEHGDGVGWAC
jgi:hypothetical protein